MFQPGIGLTLVKITFIGLMQSKKTSVMTTPKHLGAQIWQIYPLVLTSSGQEWQLADLPPSTDI